MDDGRRSEPSGPGGIVTSLAAKWVIAPVLRTLRDLILGVVLLPVLLAYVVLWILFLYLMSVVLTAVVWIWWCPRGRNVLFVYSNSPVWSQYIAERHLPYLENRAVILNWSERRLWKRYSLARLVFVSYGGRREFNPLAVVFRPFRPSRTFRFWLPFRDWKHGKPKGLEAMELEFFRTPGIDRPLGPER